jgi:hypothetical protein
VLKSIAVGSFLALYVTLRRPDTEARLLRIPISSRMWPLRYSSPVPKTYSFSPRYPRKQRGWLSPFVLMCLCLRHTHADGKRWTLLPCELAAGSRTTRGY